MWLSTIAFLVGIGFLLRSFGPLRAGSRLPNLLLSLFSLWSAWVCLPVNRPLPLIDGSGWVVVGASASFLLGDLAVRGFRRLSRLTLFRRNGLARLPGYLREICRAMEQMALDHTGALIVVERKQALPEFTGVGTQFDAEVKADLLVSLFATSSPLHDGAVVVGKGRIKGARAILPLTTRPNVPMGVGTRHRSAMGITERTDAVALVVSEEQGTMSVAYRGRIVTAPTTERVGQLIQLALKGKDIGSKA